MPTSPGGAESPNAHEQVQSFLFGEGGEPDPSVVDVVRQNPALLTEALGGDWGASPEVVRNLAKLLNATNTLPPKDDEERDENESETASTNNRGGRA